MDKRDGEYNHVDMFELPYIIEQFNYIVENNFKFTNIEIETEYFKLRKQLIKCFIHCNTQDENGNDDVDILNNSIFILYKWKQKTMLCTQ